MVGWKFAFCSANVRGSVPLRRRTQRNRFILRRFMGPRRSFWSLIYRGCCVEFFSRKQEVPALSSAEAAEAEKISIVEAAKEMFSPGMLLQTMIQGIPLAPLGMPVQTTGGLGLVMFNDATAAISMGRIWMAFYERSGALNSESSTVNPCIVGENLHSCTLWRGDENPA